MTGSHASAVGLDKSRLLIVQAAPFVGVVITPYREWFAADVGLGTDRRPLELAVYRAMLGHTVHTVSTSSYCLTDPTWHTHLFPCGLH